MEVNKKKKAIIQAHASLKIDRIYISPNYLRNYVKNNLSPNNSRILKLKRGYQNGANT